MSNYGYGIAGQKAPAWEVATWFNLSPTQQCLELSDFANKVIYLYNFQAWCRGCHVYGFPTLKTVSEHFKVAADVAFVVLQTVFEGFEQNTLARAQEVAQQYQLQMPVGHDAGPDGRGSLVMQRYRCGGTPWITLIDRQGTVRFNDFHADAHALIDCIEALRQEK